MDLKEIKASAREKMKGFCRICPTCDGRVCAGEVPGMGGAGTGSSFIENLRALSAVKLNMRTLHDAKEPDMSVEIFGQSLQGPIMGAPITGASYNGGGAISELEMVTAIVKGSAEAGLIGWGGDGADPTMYHSGLEAIKGTGKGITCIKPRSQDEIIERIKAAEKTAVTAIGIDIDGAGLVTMALKGQPVGPKTKAELTELVQATKLPLIIKGIMTVDEAVAAAEAGAQAIVVSNHGGRILDHTPGAATVLPEIAEELKGKITILVDGGVRSGTDVLKYLALGADTVLIGRPVMQAAFGGGVEAVKVLMDKYKAELYQAMIVTGCKSVQDIGPEILY
ncbi:alpha-hydroxy-acid oxidizing protein [Heliorestis acidaminivorans]|uniref:L-lactate oxidase n=1 Tax=Heliorestis acidaminivorans TaxID=553427 RepID=A0A6I0EZL0_9FIRM|nr:alpha-hydroxy-acid oxidizing protein [Heliorestis acidaminivorans]KAB2952085.1 alpha-hydroxy-acid oxidizing protein [Heliorestis acidaminivorans]